MSEAPEMDADKFHETDHEQPNMASTQLVLRRDVFRPGPDSATGGGRDRSHPSPRPQDRSDRRYGAVPA